MPATITSSAPSGGSIVFQEELGTGDTVTFLIVSIFLVGYSVGPFITAPSTEAFGRRWPSIVFMFLYTIFNGGEPELRHAQRDGPGTNER